jgi:hypothetical protein
VTKGVLIDEKSNWQIYVSIVMKTEPFSKAKHPSHFHTKTNQQKITSIGFDFRSPEPLLTRGNTYFFFFYRQLDYGLRCYHFVIFVNMHRLCRVLSSSVCCEIHR